MGNSKYILFINALLLTFFPFSKVLAQDLCKQENISPEVEALCKKIDELKLEKEVLSAEKDILDAEVNLKASELSLFKSKLPDFSNIAAPDGQTTVGAGALKFEGVLFAKVATQTAVQKLKEELKINLIDKNKVKGYKIYIYSQDDGSEDFYQYYQQYDHFNLQYNALVDIYRKNRININLQAARVKNINEYFSILRTPNEDKNASLVAAIPTIAGSIIQIKKLFNVSRSFTNLEGSVETGMLVGEIYKAFENDNTNEIYYPKLHSLEKKGVDTIINKVAHLLFLQQKGKEAINNTEKTITEKEKAVIKTLNEQVDLLLNNITSSSSQNSSTVIGVKKSAIPIITELAKGYSISTNITSTSAENNTSTSTTKKKEVFILYLKPSYGSNFIQSTSIFGSSAKISGGLMIDFKLFQISDQDGFTRIIKAGSVSSYIPPQKLNDTLSEKKLSEVLEKLKNQQEGKHP